MGFCVLSVVSKQDKILQVKFGRTKKKNSKQVNCYPLVDKMQKQKLFTHHSTSMFHWTRFRTQLLCALQEELPVGVSSSRYQQLVMFLFKRVAWACSMRSALSAIIIVCIYVCVNLVQTGGVFESNPAHIYIPAVLNAAGLWRPWSLVIWF